MCEHDFIYSHKEYYNPMFPEHNDVSICHKCGVLQKTPAIMLLSTAIPFEQKTPIPNKSCENRTNPKCPDRNNGYPPNDVCYPPERKYWRGETRPKSLEHADKVSIACPVVLDCDTCPLRIHGVCKDNIIADVEIANKKGVDRL